MRTVMNERAAVTVNTANHIRTDLCPIIRRAGRNNPRHIFGLTGCLSVTDKQFFCMQKQEEHNGKYRLDQHGELFF